MLLSSSMDPSKLISVEQRLKGKLKKKKLQCSAITKEHNSRINGVEIHDHLKTTYETDQKSKFSGT